MTRNPFIRAASLWLAASIVPGAVASDTRPTSPVDGFIYGTVEMRSGESHTGVLRWDDEEAFWDDLFQSAKRELPYMEYAETAPEEDSTWWERFGRTIGREFGIERQVRVLAVRFGDLAAVRPTGADDAVLVLRDGAEVEVSGYANDVGTTVTVIDAKPGRIQVRWKEIAEVRFSATPPDVDPGSVRLHGTVTTADRELAGFIQWDSQECLSTDRLDGDSGGERISVDMGDIRSIERRDRRSARVVLKNGEERVMSGTNDVDDDIRGIHVEDPRFGRVEVPWSEFVRVVFDDAAGSGRGYADYSAPHRLAGTVIRRNGDRSSGRLVFDLDEEWSWEMLDGSSSGLDVTVPFSSVAAIEPQGSSGSVVELRTGATLELEDSHDVGPDNDGLLVITDGGEPTFVRWADVRRVEFR
ncbi:MAG: hypothetical protein PVG53_01630 [Holophagae bacterium]|jgi:hypothetical protein